MKKSSKFISLLLALMLAVSSFTCLASVTASATDEPTTTLIYFRAPSYWGTVKSVFCNFFGIYGGTELEKPAWQVKSTKCAKVAGTTDLYAYDTAKLKDKDGNPAAVEAGADYALNFSATTAEKTTPQTGDVLVGIECLGDTVYCLGEDKRTENSVDSKKLDYIGGWEKNSDKYGARAVITSTGKIVPPTDSYFPAHQPKAEIMSQFLHNYAVKNAEIITKEIVLADCEIVGTTPMEVYDYYANAYEAELADPETYPETAPLSTIAELLGVDPNPTTEPTEPTTTEPVTTEPVTTEPVTTEPVTTTEPTEPTTAPTEPTTAPTEPTTAPTEPTTAPTEPTTAPTEPTTAPAKIWTVAGDEGLTGYVWDPAENEMTKGDYTYNDASYDYMIQFDDVAAGSYGCKVTNGTWDECYPADNNIAITTTDTGYVRVYFNSDTKDIAVDAEKSGEWTLEYITAVGNGDGNWLNGEDWNIAAESNKMTEVEPGIWEISYDNIDAFDNYQVKFACNGSWQPYNWTSDGVLDGQENPSLEVAEDGSKVTLRINVNGFDFKTGTGTVFPELIVTPPTPKEIFGDVNGDGKITIDDVTLIQKASIGLVELTDIQIIAADVSGDGRISIVDATMIQKYLAAAGGYKNIGRTGQEILRPR